MCSEYKDKIKAYRIVLCDLDHPGQCFLPGQIHQLLCHKIELIKCMRQGGFGKCGKPRPSVYFAIYANPGGDSPRLYQ